MNVWTAERSVENLTNAMLVIIKIWHLICVVNAKKRVEHLKNAMVVITKMRLSVKIFVSVAKRVRHSRLAGIVSEDFFAILIKFHHIFDYGISVLFMNEPIHISIYKMMNANAEWVKSALSCFAVAYWGDC